MEVFFLPALQNRLFTPLFLVNCTDFAVCKNVYFPVCGIPVFLILTHLNDSYVIRAPFSESFHGSKDPPQTAIGKRVYNL
jgi:hypothetical protein